MIFINLNCHEKHIQSTKHSLTWAYFDYKWFTEVHYDVFSNNDGYLHLNNGQGSIKRALGI